MLFQGFTPTPGALWINSQESVLQITECSVPFAGHAEEKSVNRAAGCSSLPRDSQGQEMIGEAGNMVVHSWTTLDSPVAGVPWIRVKETDVPYTEWTFGIIPSIVRRHLSG